MTMEEGYDMIHTFYKLKRTFDEKQEETKMSIIKNKSLSKREKRARFLEIKPKCINCNHPSKNGTLFTIHYSKSTEHTDDFRIFKIVCGNVSNPCPLHIEIHVEGVQPLDMLLDEITTELEQEKRHIIDLKNKLLFGLIDKQTAIAIFEDETELITTFTTLYEYYLFKWTQVVNNADKKVELEESIKLAYQKVNEIKELVVKMNEESDEQYALNVARISCKELEPLLSKIRQLKYSKNTWEDTRLVQQVTTIQDLEEPAKITVVANNIGQGIGKGTTKGTTKGTNKGTNKEKGTNKGTMNKLKGKQLEIQEKEEKGDEDEDEEGREEEKKEGEGLPMVESSDTEYTEEDASYGGAPISINIKEPQDPIIGRGDSGVDWTSDEYKQLWSLLPTKLKELFKLNLGWMKDFMYKNVRAHAVNPHYVYQITTPPNIQIPPSILSNGKYEFKVDIYNKLFNSMDPNTQQSYLALYKQDPLTREKSYKQMEDALNSLVEKDVQFYLHMK